MYHDCCSSYAQDSFIAMTTHFIDDFEFESVLLECALMEGSHTSVALAREIKRITDEFWVTNKVLIVVSDNASQYKNCVNVWSEVEAFRVFCSHPQFDCSRCAWNAKMKIIVTHFKGSNLDRQKLLKYQTDSMIQKKIIQDVWTRWNSTYHTIQRLV